MRGVGRLDPSAQIAGCISLRNWLSIVQHLLATVEFVNEQALGLEKVLEGMVCVRGYLVEIQKRSHLLPDDLSLQSELRAGLRSR